jgi:hypothetical protein
VRCKRVQPNRRLLSCGLIRDLLQSLVQLLAVGPTPLNYQHSIKPTATRGPFTLAT